LAGVPAVVETFHGPEIWRGSRWARKAWLDRLIELFVARNIAVSQATRDYLINKKRYPGRKIEVVPNGRDLSVYSRSSFAEVAGLRRQLGLDERRRVLVVVGRLEPQKGHSYLIAALPPVMNRFPDVQIVFAGDGSLRGQLERQAADLGLQRHVVFAGYQSPIAPFYHLAEFVVLPSLYEGMPLTAIEAGAAGKALVATDVDGTGEVVLHGETGLLVPPRLPEALSEAICELLADPSAARAMGRAARARIEREFTLERQVACTSNVYRSACLNAA
jgi:glycosyltransferase involved in cell wall biosynthesis